MEPDFDIYEARDWLAYIYNLRGLEMTPEVWDKFKHWCEANDIHNFNPHFNQLPEQLDNLAAMQQEDDWASSEAYDEQREQERFDK